jgi:hypothetical protein
MAQTVLETALANAYPQDIEKLAVDLLSERGYEVDPTGTNGADGGLDARLADGDRVGALYVSRTSIVDGRSTCSRLEPTVNRVCRRSLS